MHCRGMGARLISLHPRRTTQQVAAVCYRARRAEIEFLLVQTSGGRWTFPKGNVEPELSHAQSAALEALEEAGVHGRIEEAAFTHYVFQKRSSRKGLPVRVGAHLCEVRRLDGPQERGRNPTWFSAVEAKRKLQANREDDSGRELVRVAECALARIQRLQDSFATRYVRAARDPLQRVAFEAREGVRTAILHAAAFVRQVETQPAIKRIFTETLPELPRLSLVRQLASHVAGDEDGT